MFRKRSCLSFYCCCFCWYRCCCCCRYLFVCLFPLKQPVGCVAGILGMLKQNSYLVVQGYRCLYGDFLKLRWNLNWEKMSKVVHFKLCLPRPAGRHTHTHQQTNKTDEKHLRTNLDCDCYCDYIKQILGEWNEKQEQSCKFIESFVNRTSQESSCPTCFPITTFDVFEKWMMDGWFVGWSDGWMVDGIDGWMNGCRNDWLTDWMNRWAVFPQPLTEGMPSCRLAMSFCCHTRHCGMMFLLLFLMLVIWFSGKVVLRAMPLLCLATRLWRLFGDVLFYLSCE